MATSLFSYVKGNGFSISLLISIILQFILTLLGSFRKRSSNKLLAGFLWCAYQLADVSANTSLAILSNIPSDQLTESAPIWSSFLLFHLGGPDCITAIALVDNEHYFRHTIQLLYRIGLAGYIHIKLFFIKGEILGGRAWYADLYLMFLAGISKCSEKTEALKLANMANLRDSMLPSPNSGPIPLVLNDDDDDDPQLNPMDEPEPELAPVPTQPVPAPEDETLLKDDLDSSKEILLRGHQYFSTFKRLFVDLMLPSSPFIVETQRFFLQCPCKVAFQLIDVELIFMYDVLFTKAPVIRTSSGCNFRFIRYLALLYVFVPFIRSGEFDIFLLCVSKGRYCSNQEIFSYSVAILVFIWALFQETYEIIQMILSESTVVWLIDRNLNQLSTMILKLILFYRFLGSKLISRCGVGGVASEMKERKYSWCFNDIMAQYNLLSFCFNDEPTIFRSFLNRPTWRKLVYDGLENSWNTTSIHVSNDIKGFIFHQFKERVQTSDEEIRSAEFRNPIGKWIMKMNNCMEHNYFEELSSSIEVEFDQSILIWHVATDLCYYFDDLDSTESQATTVLRRQVEVSKALSDYLLYLLLIQPSMLNNKSGKIRFQDTCAAVKKLFDNVTKDKRGKKSMLCSFILSFIFQRKKPSLGVGEKETKDFIKRLLRSDARVPMRDTEADGSKSVLLEAQKLAIKLLSSFAEEERWKIISGVCVEMLSYAASNCSGKEHAQRLSDGGEFLTKIWLLMAHLGMKE